MKQHILVFVFFCLFGLSSYAQVNGDFRSRQSGNWNDSDTWEEFQGGAWSNSANVPSSADGEISIRSGHIVSIQSGVAITADQISVLSSATLNISSNGSLLLNDGPGNDLVITPATGGRFGTPRGLVNVYGNLRLDDNTSVSNTNLNLLIKSGGTLNLNSTSTQGTIPTATWETGSTLLVSGNTTNTNAPNGLNQNFYNFVWDTPASTANFIDLNFQPIADNDFIIENTGSTYLLFSSSSSSSYSIGRDLIINNASLVDFDYEGTITINIGRNLVLNDDAALGMAYIANTTVNITGDLNINGGALDIDASEFGGSPNGEGIINLSGNFICNGGDILKTGEGLAQLNFNGSGTIDFTNEANIEIDYSFGPNSTYDIISGALSGSGDLVVNDNVILGISSEEGISTGTTSGNIKVSGTRTYGIPVTFIYNGTSAQNIGNGLPASGFNLEINNLLGASMSNNLTIGAGRSLNLIEGSFNIGANTLTLNGTVSTSNGGLSGGSTSNLVIGGTGNFGVLGFIGTTELNNFTLNRTSSGNVTLGGPLTVVGTFEQTVGDLTLNGNSFTINGDFVQSNGSLISDGQSSLVINGAGTLPTAVSLTGDLQKLTLDRASSNFSTGLSDFAIDSLNLFSGTFTNEGTISINDGGYVERKGTGQLTDQLNAIGSYDVVYSNVVNINTGPELPVVSTALNNLIKRNTGIVTLASNSTINGRLELVNGQLDAGTQSIDLKGDFISNSNSALQDATFTFSGLTNITGTTTPTFGDISVTGTLNPMANFNVNGDLVNDGVLNSSSGTVTFGGNTTISGSQPVTFNNIDITNSLTASASQDLTVIGNISNSGSFNANEGRVIFGGTTSISGTSPNFHSIEITGTLNSPNTLFVSGNFVNNGIFNNGNGTVDMTGSGTRSIGGSSALDLFNLNVRGGTINNNNTAVSLINGVTIGANTIFDVDGSGSGNLILQSTSSTEAAYVGIIPSSSSVTGDITVERYFNVGRYYRYLGSPITDATVADWQEEIPISGNFDDPSTGTYDGKTINSSNPSLFYYDAANSEYVDYPSSGTAASNPIENGRGYTPFLRNSTSNIIGSVKGTLKQQAASLPVDFSGVPAESWNLVANPYAAPIDWDALGWTKVNVFDEVHVPIAESGGFATYIAGVGANGGSQYIASGQAFWVRTSAASPSLSTVEEVKSVDQSPVYFRGTNPLETFRVKLVSSTFSDEVVFALRDNATFSYDPEVDAVRKLNTNNKYTFSSRSEDNLNLKINSIPKLSNSNCSVTIPFIMESVSRTGNFTLSFEGVSNLTKYYSVDIIDNFTGNIIHLSSNDSYSFQVNSDRLSKNPERFSMILNNRAAPSLGSLDALSTCEGEDAIYTLTDLNPSFTYSIYNENTLVSSIEGKSQTSFSIPHSLLTYEPSNFNVYGKVGQCDSSVVGSFQAELISSVDRSIAVIGSQVCGKSSATVTIDSESGIAYNFILNGNVVAEVMGNGNQISTEIPSSHLNNGTNEVFISATTQSCGTFELESSAIITLMNPASLADIKDQSICPGESVEVNAFSSSSILNYHLYKGDSLVSENSTGIFNISPISETSYRISGVSEGGCIPSPTEFTIFVTDMQKPEISAHLNILESTVEGDSYQWFLNGEILDDEVSATIEPHKEGSYEVLVTQGNCEKISDAYLYIDQITASQKTLKQQIKLYPNPILDYLNIESNFKSLELSIFTLEGKFVEHIKTEEANANVSMGHLRQGTYYLRINVPNKGYTTYTIIKR
ncbi:hypothetical protein GCM10011506_00350 [Marivirga lumbricoides]|uniref:Secretion system C-terminal sorting domain-containing protein n=1 Tax=Marivirga lumbricoides TaxID=1046115 RepID=A0ABQ1L7I3_9BACT|nr:hypothetical protein GCM10011506_00350 [Marivirga lumbricoides]